MSSLDARKLEVPADLYGEIAATINSEDSPVGIDAKKTHVLILHKLMQIEERLARLERHSGERRSEEQP